MYFCKLIKFIEVCNLTIIMKLFFLSTIILVSLSGFSQELKTKSKSSIGDNVIYFIKNKPVFKEELVAIKPEEIESVNVVKRDTLVNNIKYTGQIFVILKSPTKKE